MKNDIDARLVRVERTLARLERGIGALNRSLGRTQANLNALAAIPSRTETPEIFVECCGDTPIPPTLYLRYLSLVRIELTYDWGDEAWWGYGTLNPASEPPTYWKFGCFFVGDETYEFILAKHADAGGSPGALITQWIMNGYCGDYDDDFIVSDGSNIYVAEGPDTTWPG